MSNFNPNFEKPKDNKDTIIHNYDSDSDFKSPKKKKETKSISVLEPERDKDKSISALEPEK